MLVFTLPQLLVGSLAGFLLYRILRPNKESLPPGPRGLPALLSLLKAFRDGSLHKQATVWRQQYGDLVLCQTVLGNLCFLNSARLVKDMFASKEREQFTNDRPKMFISWLLTRHQDLVGSDPVLCPDWPKMRKLVHSAIKFYGDGVERFESTVQTELLRLTSRIEDKFGEEVDMESTLSYSLLCVLSVLLIGECPEPDSEIIQLILDYDHINNEFFDPTVEGVLKACPFLRFVPGSYYREICLKSLRARDRLMVEMFEKVKKKHTPGNRKGIVNVFLDEQLKTENQWLTDDMIKAITQDIIGAGFLTSFGTLKGLLLFLVHNPEITRKIQKEIDDIIQGRLPCVSDRGNLPYTEAVVMETLRITSLVPLGIPHQTREDVQIEGYTVPKGSTIFANIWAYHRDPEVFPDPEVFRPERFLDGATGQLLPITHLVRQSLLPFGIGRRSCPGENFGRTRVFLYVTTLLQQFDILPPVKNAIPPPDPMLYSDGVVLQPKPYHLIFRKRPRAQEKL